jgi:hypothetical protein
MRVDNFGMLERVAHCHKESTALSQSNESSTTPRFPLGILGKCVHWEYILSLTVDVENMG